ncbi:MAG: PAS domain S-box protein, partial [Alphaproteobacteria bacterium]|nr:PAS domain S-box protein [Alphaproteobacteria bacterium]
MGALPGTAAHDILWIQVILAVGSVTTLLLSAAVADARRSEASVQRTAALLHSVIETSPEAVVTIDARGIVLSFSRAAERLFGHDAAAVIGRNVKMLMPSHFRDQHDSYIARYLATGERRIIGIGRVVAGMRKDGTTFPMELSVGEVAQGGQRVFTGFIRDLSEQQRTEMRIQEIQSELFHMSRLSDMGQFASALAHEVNQPLAAIANYSQAARQLAAASAQGKPLDGILAKVEQQADRAAQIIRRLRGFIEKHPIEYRAEDL